MRWFSNANCNVGFMLLPMLQCFLFTVRLLFYVTACASVCFCLLLDSSGVYLRVCYGRSIGE